jgi:hypothetical protein
MSICQGKCKNGDNCIYKAKKEGFCLRHFKDECPICYESIDSSQTVVLACEHKFHKKCIVPWLSKNNLTCPTCRHPVDNIILDKYYIAIDNTDKLIEEIEMALFAEIQSLEIMKVRYNQVFFKFSEIFSNEYHLRSNILSYIRKRVKNNQEYVNELNHELNEIMISIDLIRFKKFKITKENTKLLTKVFDQFKKMYEWTPL